jgi:hypothetical protein
MMKKLFVLFGVFLIVLVSGCISSDFQLTPKGGSGAGHGSMMGTEAGTGWSANENPAEAAKEALGMALNGMVDKTPEFAVIFASSASDLQTILGEARKILGEGTKIYGGTSDSRGVMTEKGYVKISEEGYEYVTMGGKRGLAVMVVNSEDMDFGVGSANFSASSSMSNASKEALLSAISNAGKSVNEMPKIVLVTITKPDEEDALVGMEGVVGKNTPIIGGTAGGPVQSVIGGNSVYDRGISLAVIYTDLPLGWVFEGGFDVKDPHSGVVTKVGGADGRSILEIDGRPALDVYDEWLGGEVDKLYEEYKDPRVVKSLLTLHPLYRKYTTETGQEYSLFSHPWPTDPTQTERGVSTSTTIKEGERVYLSQGTWETLINRIGNLPKKAKANAELGATERPVFGIGYVCAGVLGTIPETEREKMPVLMNYDTGSAPFIATFTWGEQGNLPGVGNKHGNLLTSFVLVGPKKV